MKIILFFIILFFTSFSHEYREKWVCHATVASPGNDWCLVVVIRADTKEAAELKFKKHITQKEKEKNGKEDMNAHGIKKLKDATMIEP